MKLAATMLLLPLAAAVQSSAAPLFALSAATPAFALLVLGLLTIFRGQTTAMVATPVLAVAEAWARGVEPGLLLLAYFPLVPLVDVLRERTLSVSGPGLGLLLAVLLTGVWARSVIAVAAIVDGSSASALDVIALLVLPGFVLDLVITLITYSIVRPIFGEPGGRPGLSWR